MLKWKQTGLLTTIFKLSRLDIFKYYLVSFYNMISFFKSFINNYYWVYIFLALFLFIGVRDLYFIAVLVILAVTFLSLYICPLKWNNMDMFIVLFIGYQLFSFLFSDYKFSIWYYGVKAQIIPIFFYFIGRNMMFADNQMLKRMRYPILFAMVVGLLLFFWQPSWYIAKRTIGLTAESSTNAFYEVTRLSSFWPWSYAMGFASLFYIMFYFKDLFTYKYKKKYLIYLIISLLTLVFAQQRVSIAYLAVFLVYLTIFEGSKNKRIIVYMWSLIGIICLVIYYYMINYADSSFVEYVLNRTTKNNMNLVNERFEMFGSFWNVSLFGDGLGRYGHAVIQYKMKSITDCEYIRLMAELGVFGCSIFAYIYIVSLFRAFRYRRCFSFEFMILLFFAFAMIGATPLENSQMQPFIFWYSIGRISNIKLRNVYS